MRRMNFWRWMALFWVVMTFVRLLIFGEIEDEVTMALLCIALGEIEEIKGRL